MNCMYLLWWLSTITSFLKPLVHRNGESDCNLNLGSLILFYGPLVLEIKVCFTVSEHSKPPFQNSGVWTLQYVKWLFSDFLEQFFMIKFEWEEHGTNSLQTFKVSNNLGIKQNIMYSEHLMNPFRSWFRSFDSIEHLEFSFPHWCITD